VALQATRPDSINIPPKGKGTPETSQATHRTDEHELLKAQTLNALQTARALQGGETRQPAISTLEIFVPRFLIGHTHVILVENLSFASKIPIAIESLMNISPLQLKL